MAKIEISYDTVSKEVFTTIDGAPIDDVQYAAFEEYDENRYFTLSLKPLEQDGMTINRHISAEHYDKDKKKKKKAAKSEGGFSDKHYILSVADGHFHYYNTSSPFTSTDDGHFHGVVDNEVISADDHTHTLIELTSVADAGDVEERLIGCPFEYEGKNYIYFKSDGKIKIGSWNAS